MSRFSAPRVLTVGTLLMVALPPMQAAWACSLTSYDAISGPLGTSPLRGGDERELPANALFLDTQGQIGSLRLEDGTSATLVPLPGPKPPAGSSILGPAVNVAGMRVEFESASLTFSQARDSTPPPRPILEDVEERELGESDRGCMESSGSSCDGLRRVDAQLSNVSDDVASLDHLVFAIYRGNSAEEASEARVPGQWMVSDESEARLRGLAVDRGRWISVSVIDEAGNESERSEAKACGDRARV